MVIPIPIREITLLRLYYEDKVWEVGMPTFDELSHLTKGYLLDSFCYALFVNSQRAADLQLEMLAKMN